MGYLPLLSQAPGPPQQLRFLTYSCLKPPAPFPQRLTLLLTGEEPGFHCRVYHHPPHPPRGQSQGPPSPSVGVDGSSQDNQLWPLELEAWGWDDHPAGTLAQRGSRKSEGAVSGASFGRRRWGEWEEALLQRGPGVPGVRAWAQRNNKKVS